jgi:polysaccharide chain length determinant protein (PEP-CTERM system associated)
MDNPRNTTDRTPETPVPRTREPYTAEAVVKIGWRRRWHILLPAAVVAAAAGWWIHQLPDRYRAEAVLLAVPQRVPDSFVRPTVTTRADQRLQQLTQQVLSRTELERIIQDLDLYAEDRKTDPMEAVVEAMRTRDLDVRPVKGDAFRLGYSAESPETARRVVERLVSLFVDQASLDRTTLAEGTDRFLEAQLEDARARLIENETQLAEYRRRHNGELPTQIDANLRGLHNTEMQIQALADALSRDRERQLVLQRALDDAALADVAETRSQVDVADESRLPASERLARAEARLREMQSNLTELHPDLIAMRGRVAELRVEAGAARADSPASNPADALRLKRQAALRAELAAVERQIAARSAEEERLRRVLLNYQYRIEAAPSREAELASLTRDYDTLQQTYRGLLAKKQDAEIAANLERQPIGAQFKVLDPARLPEQPFAPKRPRLYALGVLAGLFVGMMLAAILQLLDHGMRTEAEVRAALGLPVIAAIPFVPAGRSRPRRALVAASTAAAILGGAAALAWLVVQP